VSDLDTNLKVLTDHLGELAAKHSEAGGKIKAAERAVDGLSGRMWQSHGVICARTNLAVSSAETIRASAIKNQDKMSDQLEERLDWAAANYTNTDWLNGETVAACSV